MDRQTCRLQYIFVLDTWTDRHADCNTSLFLTHGQTDYIRCCDRLTNISLLSEKLEIKTKYTNLIEKGQHLIIIRWNETGHKVNVKRLDVYFVKQNNIYIFTKEKSVLLDQSWFTYFYLTNKYPRINKFIDKVFESNFLKIRENL